jgi:hypothetical protein
MWLTVKKMEAYALSIAQLVKQGKRGLINDARGPGKRSSQMLLLTDSEAISGF